MIISKTIELWYKGEFIASRKINNNKTEHFYRRAWEKHYGKKLFNSPACEVRMVVEETIDLSPSVSTAEK